MAPNDSQLALTELRTMRLQLFAVALFFALSLALFEAPGWLEGPSLLHLSPGRGVSVSDVLALIPLAVGAALILTLLWRHRSLVARQFHLMLTAGGAELFCAGLALGLIIAKGLSALQWNGLFSLAVAASPLLVPLVMLRRKE